MAQSFISLVPTLWSMSTSLFDPLATSFVLFGGPDFSFIICDRHFQRFSPLFDSDAKKPKYSQMRKLISFFYYTDNKYLVSNGVVDDKVGCY